MTRKPSRKTEEAFRMIRSGYSIMATVAGSFLPDIFIVGRTDSKRVPPALQRLCPEQRYLFMYFCALYAAPIMDWKLTRNFVLRSLLFLPLFSGCASIVPPSGGAKDTTPPKLLSSHPEDSSLNRQVYQVTLSFNKFMEVHDLDKQMTMSPLLPMSPTVTAIGKTVTIKLPDFSLKPNTTYRIALGNALTDNREQTPYPDFVYLFSTGSYFDSLQLKGRVTDAATGLPDSAATIFLYPETASDSVVFKERPDYISKVGPNGYFVFKNLPEQPFKIFAVADQDNNHLYTPGTEKIDFFDSVVTPSASPDSSIVFSLFKEIADTAEGKEPLPQQEAADRFTRHSKNQNQSALPYRVIADTLNQKSGTFDLGKPLQIVLFQRIATLDSDRIYLSYDDKGMEVEAVHTLVTDSAEILVQTRWLPDKTYTLRLIKGWATDTSNQELPPGKFTFHTRSLEDYATLNINMPAGFIGAQYLLILLKEGQEVWKASALTSNIKIPLLSPGEYTLRLVMDKNENGRWDTGNLLEKKHAEKVLPYKGTILLKAGWVNDIDFQ